MIKEVLNHINTQLEQLNLFTKYFTLTEKITRGEKSFPAVFENEFKGFVSDNYNNMVYHRVNGAPSFTEQESQIGCGTDFTYTIPLKLVAYIKQVDQYNLFNIAENISFLLIKGNSSTLKSTLNAYSASILPRSINTQGEDVFKGEFSDNVKYSDSFISVDYDVVISMSKACVLDLDCAPLETCYVKVYDENGNILLSGTCGNNYTINIAGANFTLLVGTLPAAGTDIQDKNGVSIGTWVSVSEVYIPALASKDINQFDVSVNEVALVWDNNDDTINTLDDSLSVNGTLKLFAGVDLFQPGSQIKILL